jgi:hypothetical protein
MGMSRLEVEMDGKGVTVDDYVCSVNNMMLWLYDCDCVVCSGADFDAKTRVF